MRRALWERGDDTVGPCVAAIGVFDGVHIGHLELLRDTVALASSEGIPSAVLTFEPDPHVLLEPESHPPRIVDADTRARLIARAGIDVLVEIPFTSELAALDAVSFADAILHPALRPAIVVVGEDFRFGVGAAGDVSTLAKHGASHEYRVVARELAVLDGAPITATRIRDLVTRGDVDAAARLLGRPFGLTGDVVHGRELGRALDAPTANIIPPEGSLVPGDGVYAGRATLDDGATVDAAVSVGVPPSFEDASTNVVEAHLLDLDADLYGRSLHVDFIARLRDHVAFDDPQALAGAIAQDIRVIRELLQQ